MIFRLVAQNGKLTVMRPGQSSFTLVEKSKDAFSIAGAPDAYEVNVVRNQAGEVSGLSIKQPKGNIEMQRVAGFKSPIAVEELMTRVINALGGEANLRKHQTLETTYDVDLVNQGVSGTGTLSQKMPDLKTNFFTLNALGKPLGTIREYFDGTTGGVISSFLPPGTKSQAELTQEQAASDFYAPLNWQKLYKKVEIAGTTKIGGEDAYIVAKTLNDNSAMTDYISAKTYLLLKCETTRGVTEYGDYRETSGVMLPFKWTVESPNTGRQIVNVKTAKFDVPISDKVFTGAPDE